MKLLAWLGLVAMVAACLPADVFARAKTDLVFIGKADRITGEIKQMSRGILTLKTDNIGTVNIEWEDVDSLTSVYQFRVEDNLGAEHFGSIFLGKDGKLEVIRPGVTESVDQLRVIAITPLEASFWQRLDGSINLGFSYTKASSLAQLTTDINVRYRTTIRQVTLDASSITTSQKDENSQREDLSITYDRLFPGRFFSTTSTTAQKNDELGLDLRLSFATGLGADLIQTNHNLLVSTAGLSANREWSANADGGYNLEAFFSLEHSVFRYDYPKTDVTLQGTAYPSLSSWGRLRSEVDISATREIVKNLTIVITFYDSYDSDPGDPSAQKNDYGLVSSLGWTF